ncbi:MAG: enoyl-CoA hydratase/isomerase family protein [Acidimicrobiales bacterium]
MRWRPSPSTDPMRSTPSPPTMLAELNAAAEAAAGDASVRVVVFTGNGRAFSAGVDLKAPRRAGARRRQGWRHPRSPGPPAHVDAVHHAQAGHRRRQRFLLHRGLELALACDVIAADEAKFTTPTPSGASARPGMSQRLPALVGLARARYLSYTARNFTGAEAAAWGLAAVSVPRDDLRDTVAALADEMKENSAESFVAYKDLFNAAEQLGIEAGLAYEAEHDYPFTDTDQRLAGFR